ncbi:hypothetical protein BpHYR1_009548 [Brachionus plicatilis]|uniref:Transmembrane protein n=1 Tax=Brachionus plicatilis TaxID=10195 RepID=A0A3M7Q458_BRAPC|nr:hypothetical protein BpHYR1_009548 [Brachionus plicatilis]
MVGDIWHSIYGEISMGPCFRIRNRKTCATCFSVEQSKEKIRCSLATFSVLLYLNSTFYDDFFCHSKRLVQIWKIVPKNKNQVASLLGFIFRQSIELCNSIIRINLQGCCRHIAVSVYKNLETIVDNIKEVALHNTNIYHKSLQILELNLKIVLQNVSADTNFVPLKFSLCKNSAGLQNKLNLDGSKIAEFLQKKSLNHVTDIRSTHLGRSRFQLCLKFKFISSLGFVALCSILALFGGDGGVLRISKKQNRSQTRFI